MKGAQIFWNEVGRSDFPMHWMLVFLEIGESPTPFSQIAKKFPFKQSSISRCFQALTGTSKVRLVHKFPALAEYAEDPADRRCKLIWLNERGKRLKELMK